MLTESDLEEVRNKLDVIRQDILTCLNTGEDKTSYESHTLFNFITRHVKQYRLRYIESFKKFWR